MPEKIYKKILEEHGIENPEDEHLREFEQNMCFLFCKKEEEYYRVILHPF